MNLVMYVRRMKQTFLFRKCTVLFGDESVFFKFSRISVAPFLLLHSCFLAGNDGTFVFLRGNLEKVYTNEFWYGSVGGLYERYRIRLFVRCIDSTDA